MPQPLRFDDRTQQLALLAKLSLQEPHGAPFCQRSKNTIMSIYEEEVAVSKRSTREYNRALISYLNPSVAIFPSAQTVKFLGWVAPITSEKWVSHSACVGKSFGCVCGDHRPSNTT